MPAQSRLARNHAQRTIQNPNSLHQPGSCMDAPCRARVVGDARGCDRMRSCIRPVVRTVLTAGRHGDAQVWCKSILRARSPMTRNAFPDPDLTDHFALTTPRTSHTPDAPGTVRAINRSGCNSRRISEIFTFGKHRPNRSSHLVGQSYGYQHSRLAPEHAE